MAHYDAHTTRPASAGLAQWLTDAFLRFRFAGNAPSNEKPEAACKTALDAETSRDAGVCREYHGYSSSRGLRPGRDPYRTAERIRAGLPG
ncbi:hypothetical protein HPQ64_06590 [Rhizobiales bacterium]|uniref:hypothetical protein n=1 Tax=Hongsoonwoonella zoysiae TaxID=2821844 RepID=UPI0015614F1E|nr:hypothetical protein [Hongsoonwoonella zoysiae]NRG17349.1 hypothetical protein [Hongsoonwoonella zoysiae]